MIWYIILFIVVASGIGYKVYNWIMADLEDPPIISLCGYLIDRYIAGDPVELSEEDEEIILRRLKFVV